LLMVRLGFGSNVTPPFYGRARSFRSNTIDNRSLQGGARASGPPMTPHGASWSAGLRPALLDDVAFACWRLRSLLRVDAGRRPALQLTNTPPNNPVAPARGTSGL